MKEWQETHFTQELPTADDYAWRFFTMARASGMLADLDDNGAAEKVTFEDWTKQRSEGMDFEKNLQQAAEWGSSIFVDYSLLKFTLAVFPAMGKWDFKRDEVEHSHEKDAAAVLGNFHFGAVAAAMGLARREMMMGGIFHFPPGEPKRDRETILLGAEFYSAYRSKRLASPTPPRHQSNSNWYPLAPGFW